MNALTTTGNGGAVATTDDAYDPYAEYGQESSTPIVGKLLKFSKGDWMVGDDEVAPGTRFIANMPSILLGWILWEDNKPIEQLMGLLEQRHRPQKRDTLGHDDESLWPLDTNGKPQDPWQETNYLVLKAADGDQLYTFSTSSAGGRGAISKLCRDYGTKRRMYPGKLPIVEVRVDKYKHKDPTIGWIKVPEFAIVGFVPASDFEGVPEEQAQGNLLEHVGRGTQEGGQQAGTHF